MRRVLSVVLLVGLLSAWSWPAAAFAQAGEEPTLLERLRAGGHVILFRHAVTDRAHDDRDRQNLDVCETQRNLSDLGRAQALSIGLAIRRLEIPIGSVLASPYCRTLETARLAFGRVEPSYDLVSQLSDDGPAGRERLTTALRTLLAHPPEPGTNTVLVTHDLNIGDATGLSVEEGAAIVAAPDDAGGFTVVAVVEAGGWDVLDSAPVASAPSSPNR